MEVLGLFHDEIHPLFDRGLIYTRTDFFPTLFLHWGLVNGIVPHQPKLKEEEKGWNQVSLSTSV